MAPSPPSVRSPRAEELARLQAIERDAGQAFLAVEMPLVADAAPPTIAELEAHRVKRTALVAVDGRERPIAYLIWSIVDAAAHIDQVSVIPQRAREGIGATLIAALEAHAIEEGRPALTLTTFRDVAWNAPYYARLGFAVVDPARCGPQLRALTAAERATIPGDAPRVAMRRPTSPYFRQR